MLPPVGSRVFDTIRRIGGTVVRHRYLFPYDERPFHIRVKWDGATFAYYDGYDHSPESFEGQYAYIQTLSTLENDVLICQ